MVSATLLSAALTLIPTLIPGAKRRLVALLELLMLSTMSMLTSELETPSVWAIASLKLFCLAVLNSDTVKGIDKVIVTFKGLTEMTSRVSAEELLGENAHEAAAGDDEILPDSHSSQSPTPPVSLYLPGIQAMQGPPSWPAYPALQVQLVRSSLPDREFVFEGQSEHC